MQKIAQRNADEVWTKCSESRVSEQRLLALLQLLYYAFKIRIACAKAPGDEVSAARGDGLAIGDDFKLSCLPRSNYGVNPQPIFDEGCETRNLGLIVFSSGAGTYLNFHSVLQFCNFFHPNPRPTAALCDSCFISPSQIAFFFIFLG